ncbi:hypothetical protein BGHDH14_bgh04899 [Blumeria hordei DH14]|uniref:Uncharacterized protein n=1 Tax=Blumeria graminis f. sp. hordei (strain DH14) TaxID=546991 RepID=N1JD83_BLUG1|nr:hypothetical protein BGHDH14_bgh04899 [Blumeria hordei DH14]
MPLTGERVARCMVEAVSNNSQDDKTYNITNPYQAIALFSHACIIASGLRLIGLSEGQVTEEECNHIAPRLPTEWSASLNYFTFMYMDQQSSSKYVVKVDQLGDKAEIRAIKLGENQISRLEVAVGDYISSTALPLRLTITATGDEDRSDLDENFEKVFFSHTRLKELMTLIYDSILVNMVTSTTNDNHDLPISSLKSTNNDKTKNDTPLRKLSQTLEKIQPNNTPCSIPTQPCFSQDLTASTSSVYHPGGDFPPPGFDDEYDMMRLPHSRPHIYGEVPFNIGHDDLNPPSLGPHDPLRGSFVGGGIGGGTRGMHPTFGEPLFGGVEESNSRGYRAGVPPGARYYPTGPGDLPSNRGGPPNPFQGFGGGGFI